MLSWIVLLVACVKLNVASRVKIGYSDLQALADPFSSEDSSSQLTALGYLLSLTIS
jgi:hypothetical protein